jgi:predicted ATPase/transcriptional regulator with XRE-family HTH domain
MENNLSFGYWLRRRRKAMDFTQSELGRRVGASEIMIRKIEADERRPSVQLAELLANRLAVPEDEREVFINAARNPASIENLPLVNHPIIKHRTPPTPPSNLPAPMTSMIDRVADLEVVTSLIIREDVRIITITGAPGIGKTRLSITAAEQTFHHFIDGAWFVDLSAVIEPELVLQTIAVTLGLPPQGRLSPEKQLHLSLRDKEMLLVLDNLEQLVDKAALYIANLLRSCRKVKVLATSRVRLDIYGEHEYMLPSMSVPPPALLYDVDQLVRYEAVQLFIARACQHQSGFLLTEQNATPVAEICQRMDGLPLALELAAARLRSIPVKTLAEAMREASGIDWLKLFRSSALDIPQRQRTLLNTVAWSYSLLSADLQSMLRQLSVFSGSFDWAAVSGIIDVPDLVGEASVFEGFEELINHNLVNEVSASPKRWRLLEMVREFSESELAPEEANALRWRHAHHFFSRLIKAGKSSPLATFLAECDMEVHNMRAALRFALEIADATLAQQIAQVMRHYWELRGLLEEGSRSLKAVLALPCQNDDTLAIDNLHGAANLAWMQHDLETAQAYASQALDLASRCDNTPAKVSLLNLQGRIYLEEERYEDADLILTEGIQLEDTLHQNQLTPFMTIQRGEAALAQDRLDLAEELLHRGLSSIDPVNQIPYCIGWNNLAEVALRRGSARGARAALKHVLPLALLHARREVIFMNAIAGLLLLERTAEGLEVEVAVRLISYINRACDRSGTTLSPITQKQMKERLNQTQCQIPSDQWQSLWYEGQRWTSEKAYSVAGDVLGDR